MNPSLLLLIGIAAMAACVWTAKYILVTAVLLPFLSAYFTARLAPSWSVVYYAAAAAVCYLLLGQIWILAFAMILLSGVLTAVAVRKKIPSYEAVLLSCAGWILAILAVIGYCHLQFETDPLTLIMGRIRGVLAENDIAASLGYLWLRAEEMSLAVSKEAYTLILNDTLKMVTEGSMESIREYVLTDSSLGIFNNYIALKVPAMCMKLSLTGGLFSYLSARAICKANGMQVAPIAKLKDFKLPVKTTTPLALFFAAAVIASSVFDLPSTWEMLCYMLTESLSVVFAIQAVTLIHWFLSMRCRNKGTMVLLSILIPLGCLLLGARILTWIGFFEMMFKLRYRVTARPINKQ